MKKFLALVLSAALLICVLAGCGGRDKEIVGTWKTGINMTDMMNEEFANEGMGDYIQLSDFTLVVDFTFKDNGTYTCEMDSAALDQTLEGMKAEMSDGLIKYVEATIAEQGMDMSAEDFLAKSGVSLDQLMDEAFSQESIDELVGDIAGEGNYETKDGKLFMSDGLDYKVDPNVYEVYSIEGDKMTFEENVGSEDNEMAEFYPIEFTRVG